MAKRILRSIGLGVLLTSLLIGNGNATPAALPAGVCAVIDRGDENYELRMGKPPIEATQDTLPNKILLDTLRELEYPDDHRVVKLAGPGGYATGYLISPDLVLTVSHALGGVLTGTPRTQIARVYDTNNSFIGRDEDGSVRHRISDELRKSGLPMFSINHSTGSDGITTIIVGTNSASLEQLPKATLEYRIKGEDIALLKLESPVPHIEDGVVFRSNYKAGEEILAKIAPSEFIHGVASENTSQSHYIVNEESQPGNSGSIITDKDGKILGVLYRAFNGSATWVDSNGTHHERKDYEVASSLSPSELVQFLQGYCATTKAKAQTLERGALDSSLDNQLFVQRNGLAVPSYERFSPASEDGNHKTSLLIPNRGLAKTLQLYPELDTPAYRREYLRQITQRS